MCWLCPVCGRGCVLTSLALDVEVVDTTGARLGSERRGDGLDREGVSAVLGSGEGDGYRMGASGDGGERRRPGAWLGKGWGVLRCRWGGEVPGRFGRTGWC